MKNQNHQELSYQKLKEPEKKYQKTHKKIELLKKYSSTFHSQKELGKEFNCTNKKNYINNLKHQSKTLQAYYFAFRNAKVQEKN
jgi:hypothetical protein